MVYTNVIKHLKFYKLLEKAMTECSRSGWVVACGSVGPGGKKWIKIILNSLLQFKRKESELFVRL